MNYARARGEIRSGHLLAWTHRGLSWSTWWYDLQIHAVRAFTQSDYCHVGIAYRLERRLLVFEAVRPKVRIFPLSELLPFYWLPVPAVWTRAVERWLWKQVGKPYSRWQALLAGAGRLKAGKDEEWQCAELAQVAERRMKVRLPGKATPQNLCQQAMQLAPCRLVTRSPGRA